MEVRYLRYTLKEFQNIIEYYLGTPKIYKYCYEKSSEFKEFVDNINESRKKEIKKLHMAYYAVNCKEPLVHLGTFGLSFLGKKIAENKEFQKLDETINSDEFKTLFTRFDEVLAVNGIEWLNE
ncbi:MAG: hypothetical protein IJ426_02375 [Clostridia bacterium]|nr:hypothetical protein [Clostridia bacterium]